MSDLSWRRDPPDAAGYRLREREVVREDRSVRERVTVHHASRMRDGRILINPRTSTGQPNYVDVTSPTLTARTSHWWWFGPIPQL